MGTSLVMVCCATTLTTCLSIILATRLFMVVVTSTTLTTVDSNPFILTARFLVAGKLLMTLFAICVRYIRCTVTTPYFMM